MRGILTCILAFNASIALSEAPITIQLDWDSDTLSSHQIFEIENFREAFPHVEFSHMINPRIFLNSPEQVNIHRALMQRVIRSQDAVGIYISASKKICEEAQVFYRDQPTFWSFDSLKACNEQCDDDVPLTVYSDNELQKIFSVSVDVLRKENFLNSNRVKFHGYIINQKLAKIANDLGFKPYLSSIDPSTLVDEIKHFPLLQFIRQSWEDFNDSSEQVSLDLMPFQKSKEFIQKRIENDSSAVTTVTVSVQSFHANEFRLRQLLKP